MIRSMLSGMRSLFLGADLEVSRPRMGDQLSVGPMGGELTGYVNEIIGEFDPHRITTERMIQMRNDPDVAFGSALVSAPLINLNLRIDSKEPKFAAFAMAAYQPHLRSILRSLAAAMFFGYRLIEPVWKTGPFTYREEGKDGTSTVLTEPLAWTFERFKPIDGRTITLIADEKSGKFLGVRQSGFGTGDVFVSAEQLMLWSFRDEDVDGNPKGFPIYYQVYQPWHSKQRTLLYRDAFLKNDANPIPIGRASIDGVKDEKGTVRDGYAHMRRLGASRQQRAFVVLPNSRDEKGNYKWDLEYRESQSRAADIYQQAIDKDGIQILRAHGITDEVGTSQETGSRSRSQTHAETFNETLKGYVDEAIDILNEHLKRFEIYNKGQEHYEQSETRFVGSGISNGTLDTYAEIIGKVMDAETSLQQGTSIPLRKRIDAVAMCKELKVPLLPEDEVEPDPPAQDPNMDPNAPGGGPITPDQEAAVSRELSRRGVTDLDFSGAAPFKLGPENLGEIRTAVRGVVQEELDRVAKERKAEELAIEPPVPPAPPQPLIINTHTHIDKGAIQGGDVTVQPQKIDVHAGAVTVQPQNIEIRGGDVKVDATLLLKPGDKKTVEITNPDGSKSTATITPSDGGNKS